APGGDPFAPGGDPFAPGGQPALAGANAFDPFGGPNALDPFAPNAAGEDPFAGAGTGILKTPDPFAIKQPTPRPMPRPVKKAAPKDDDEPADEIPLDPNEALALL